MTSDRYLDFLARNAAKSGVSPKEARRSGVDIDSFARVAKPGEVSGRLILKVWNNKSTPRMLWCYVEGDDGRRACFPTFFYSERNGESLGRKAADIHLGNCVRATFAMAKDGKHAACKSFERM